MFQKLSNGDLYGEIKQLNQKNWLQQSEGQTGVGEGGGHVKSETRE